MGIDRSDVRFVVHAGAPRSLEHYQQESGRAGRDGLEAECLLIYSPADFMKWRAMLEQNGELNDASRTLLRQMERYASGVGCRHRHLSEYFGDRYDKDGAAAATTASTSSSRRPSRSCSRGRFCRASRVSASASAPRTSRACFAARRASRSSAAGTTGSARSGCFPMRRIAEVRGYIEQLIGAELLQQTDGVYPVVALTHKGPRAAEGSGERARASRSPGSGRRGKGAPRAQSRVEAESWQDVDRDLFERLRSVRLEIARSRGVPPYVIFHDATLREMARLRPTSIDALLAVKGVGARKADDLGGVFLDAIRAHA